MNRMLFHIILGLMVIYCNSVFADDFNVYEEIVTADKNKLIKLNDISYIHSPSIYLIKTINPKAVMSPKFVNEMHAYIPTYHRKPFNCLSKVVIAVNSSSNTDVKLIQDFNINSTWCVKGAGYKEYVEFIFDYCGKREYQNMPVDSIYILPGAGPSDKQFKMNNRIKTAILAIKAKNVKVTRYGEELPTLISVGRLYFNDEYKFHYFAIPGYNIKSGKDNFEVTLYIESVYPGSKNNNTYISEVFFTMRRSNDEGYCR